MSVHHQVHWYTFARLVDSVPDPLVHLVGGQTKARGDLSIALSRELVVGKPLLGQFFELSVSFHLVGTCRSPCLHELVLPELALACVKLWDSMSHLDATGLYVIDYCFNILLNRTSASVSVCPR